MHTCFHLCLFLSFAFAPRQLHQELFTFDSTVKIYRELVSSLTELGIAANMKPEQKMLVNWCVGFGGVSVGV